MKKVPTSQLPKQAKLLEKIFFEFHEPFDKELAIKDLGTIGGLATLETNKLLFYYHELFKRLHQILKLTLDQKSTIPHSIVVSDFSFFVHILYLVQDNRKFFNLYQIDFSDFDPLEGNRERLREKWYLRQGEFIDHDAKIRNIMRLKGIADYPLPYRLDRFLQIVDNNIKEQQRLYKEFAEKYNPDFGNSIVLLSDQFHWDTKDKNVYLGKNGKYQFHKGNSHRKRVFKLIESKRGEVIQTSKIATNIQISTKNVGSTVNQLNKIIEKLGLTIKKSGDGRLKIIEISQ